MKVTKTIYEGSPAEIREYERRRVSTGTSRRTLYRRKSRFGKPWTAGEVRYAAEACQQGRVDYGVIGREMQTLDVSPTGVLRTVDAVQTYTKKHISKVWR